jgi:periplasmic divalent cation tolerance protein
MRIVLFITAGKKAEAEAIAQELVRLKLAACVNIVKGVDSLFRWEGKVDRAKELLLIVKSRRELLPKIIKAVRALHSYKVPEIIALPIAGGFDKYLKWIDGSVSGKS